MGWNETPHTSAAYVQLSLRVGPPSTGAEALLKLEPDCDFSGLSRKEFASSGEDLMH